MVAERRPPGAEKAILTAAAAAGREVLPRAVPKMSKRSRSPLPSAGPARAGASAGASTAGSKRARHADAKQHERLEHHEHDGNDDHHEDEGAGKLTGRESTPAEALVEAIAARLEAKLAPRLLSLLGPGGDECAPDVPASPASPPSATASASRERGAPPKRVAMMTAVGGVGRGGLDSLPVAKVFATAMEPNFRRPWQTRGQRSVAGTACLLRGRRILTNAHVVEHAAIVTLLKHGDPRQYVARVRAVAHEFDLALLELSDAADAEPFWSGIAPLIPSDELPELNAAVSVLGYPTGSDCVSVTKGVVSRVLTGQYAHSNIELLKLQIDAAVNGGNSGGPALVDGRLVGIVSESHERAQGVHFAIPTLVVAQFLARAAALPLAAPRALPSTATRALPAAADGKAPLSSGGLPSPPSPPSPPAVVHEGVLARATSEMRKNVEGCGGSFGVCSLGIKFATCENPGRRAHAGLAAGDTGVLVLRVYPLSDCVGVLEERDVLLAIAGVAIANDGSVPLRDSGERVGWSFLVSSRLPGDTIGIQFKRRGELRDAKIALTGRTVVHSLERAPEQPGYVVFGGLVFLACSSGYMAQSYETKEGLLDLSDCPIALQQAWFHEPKRREQDEVVLLAQVLADQLCIGYSQLANRLVRAVNGVAIHSLHQLRTLIADQREAAQPPEFFVVDTCEGDAVVLPWKAALDAHPAILARNQIHREHAP
jgi:S1-C subfamily serine protease